MIRIIMSWVDEGEETGQTVEIDSVENETEAEIINAAVAITAVTQAFREPLESFMKENFQDEVVAAGKRLAISGLMQKLGGKSGHRVNKETLKEMLMGGKEIPPEAALAILMSGGGGIGNMEKDESDEDEDEHPKKEVRNKRKMFNQFKGDNL